MKPLAVSLLALLTLPGCALVLVSADGGRPSIAPYLLGVKVSRGRADAIGVRQFSAGFWRTCYAAGLGVSSSFCVVIDARSCAAAIMEDGHGAVADKPLLTRIANKAHAECLGKETPK